MIEGVAMKKKKVKLNKKQQQAVDLILSGVNVFLTGDAGTGKTTVVQQSVKALEKDEKNVLIAATTGVAADNIGMGAVTVHKAFGLGIEFEKYKDAPGFRSSYLQEADVVIIDEIGMCRFDLFSAIVKNIIAENNKRLEPGYSCNGKKKNAVQLIVVGDFFQLPPVIKKEDREILVEMYGTEYEQGEICERGYAFFSRAWKEMEFHCVKLEEVCRQKDAEFLGILNDIKYGRNLQNVIAYLESNQSSDLMEEAPYLVGKGIMMVLSALLMDCFLAISVEAKSIEKDTYRICKNEIFIDYDQLNCKKIVTEVKDDGAFIVVDLGEWLEEQDVYDIFVIEDDENNGYKKRFMKES